jgi:hypothetical protein
LFAASVDAFSVWNCQEPFFESARKPLPSVDSLSALRRTEQFDAALRSGGGLVESHPELNFRYVEREIVPARTTTGETYSNGLNQRRFIRFDLLLASDLPILAEVKLAGDNQSAYLALIQLIASLAEIATPSQRHRLWRYYGHFLPAAENSSFDLYLLFHNFNFRSKPKCEMLRLTDQLTAKLVDCPEFARHVRRIAAFDSAWNGRTIEFTCLFCHSANQTDQKSTCARAEPTQAGPRSRL